MFERFRVIDENARCILDSLMNTTSAGELVVQIQSKIR